MAVWLTGVAGVEVTGPYQVRVKTETPMPLLMDNIGPLFVIPARTGPDAGVEDFGAFADVFV